MPNSVPKPNIDTNLLPQLATDSIYLKYVNNNTTPASIMPGPVPTLPELLLLKQELIALQNDTENRLEYYSKNNLSVSKWLDIIDPDGSRRESYKSAKIKAKKEDESNSKNIEQESVASLPETPDRMSDTVVDKIKKVPELKVKNIENGTKIRLSVSGAIDAGIVFPIEKTAGKNFSSIPSKSAFVESYKSRPSPSKKERPLKRDTKKKKLDKDIQSARSTPEPEHTTGPAEGDYSRVKVPTNQIPIVQFWSFAEQYLRNLTADDIQSLKTNGDEITPYMIPPLGKPYLKQWEEEDIRLSQLLEEGAPLPPNGVNREYIELDDTVFEGDIHIGTLSQRLLASFIREGVVPDQTIEEEDPTLASKFVNRYRTKAELSLFEERLKLELKHIGLIPPDSHHETDQNEITSQLLKHQEELRNQIRINSKRKSKLLTIAQEHMAYQEYNALLDDVNKNIESVYTKRFKTVTKKGTKKKLVRESRPLSDPVIHFVQNRKKLINDVGSVYFPKAKFELPSESIYQDINDSYMES
ncbi:histone acetyltransferases subunit 3-domain-containing protein [Globomyces pollinis-pini]|nr:histone acetyltransferases subunit 3-domain-containing protein [Globomyces pollinis-pini]